MEGAGNQPVPLDRRVGSAGALDPVEKLARRQSKGRAYKAFVRRAETSAQRARLALRLPPIGVDPVPRTIVYSRGLFGEERTSHSDPLPSRGVPGRHGPGPNAFRPESIRRRADLAVVDHQARLRASGRTPRCRGWAQIASRIGVGNRRTASGRRKTGRARPWPRRGVGRPHSALRRRPPRPIRPEASRRDHGRSRRRSVASETPFRRPLLPGSLRRVQRRRPAREREKHITGGEQIGRRPGERPVRNRRRAPFPEPPETPPSPGPYRRRHGDFAPGCRNGPGADRPLPGCRRGRNSPSWRWRRICGRDSGRSLRSNPKTS